MPERQQNMRDDVTYHGGKAQIERLVHHVAFRDFGCTFDRGQRVEHRGMTIANRIEQMRVVEDRDRVRLLISGKGWEFKAEFEKEPRS